MNMVINQLCVVDIYIGKEFNVNENRHWRMLMEEEMNDLEKNNTKVHGSFLLEDNVYAIYGC
jgi:hypothetical protein